MCGDTISSPGNYWLLADCSGSGIDINSSNVTLYLNGHTMTGPGASARTIGVFVDDRGSTISGVRIKGPGTVTGYAFDIDLGVFDSLGVSNSAVGLVATPGGDQGITLSDAAGGGNIITSNASNGDRFGVADFGTGNQIGQNTTDGNSDSGIEVLGTGDTISNNTAQGNSFDLFDNNPGCDSNVWRNNHFTTSNQSCIH